jgi:hypothetical protein
MATEKTEECLARIRFSYYMILQAEDLRVMLGAVHEVQGAADDLRKECKLLPDEGQSLFKAAMDLSASEGYSKEMREADLKVGQVYAAKKAGIDLETPTLLNYIRAMFRVAAGTIVLAETAEGLEDEFRAEGRGLGDKLRGEACELMAQQDLPLSLGRELVVEECAAGAKLNAESLQKEAAYLKIHEGVLKAVPAHE